MGNLTLFRSHRIVVNTLDQDDARARTNPRPARSWKQKSPLTRAFLSS